MRILLFVLMMLVCSRAWATDYCASAAGCWLFREGSSTVDDSSSNNNVGTFNNGASWSSTVPAAYTSYSAFLDNKTWNYTDNISLGTDSSLNLTGSVTVVSWVRTVDYTTQQQIYARGAWKSGGIYFQIYQSKLYFTTNQSGAFQETSSVNTVFSNDTYFHVAAVLDGTTGYLYIGGSIPSYSANPSHTAPSSYSGTARIGIYTDGSSQGFCGYISETAVFSSALNSTQINDIMDNGLSPSGPSSHTTIIRNAVIRNGVIR